MFIFSIFSIFNKICFRKGALILYSEDLVTKKSTDDFRSSTSSSYYEKNSLNDDIPFKTVNDLQKNVLYYGINQNDVCF